MPDSIFPDAASSASPFDAGYKVPAALVITFDEKTIEPDRGTFPAGRVIPKQIAYDFMVQGIQYDIPERTQLSNGFADNLQIYSFGRGTRTASITGYILFSNESSRSSLRDFVSDWDKKIRARKAVEKGKGTITLSMAGLVLKLLPLQMTFSRQVGSDQYGNLTINGIILFIDQQ